MPTTFDNGTWRLSNGNQTATSPNNDTKGGINSEYASTAIPDHQKTYFEFKVSGAAIQTAFGVGFGQHGSDIHNINIDAKGVDPKHSTYDIFSYNRTITNGGYVVSDPENNAHGNFGAAGAAPNAWPNGATIGVAVDRVNNQVTYTLDGHSQGTFPISAMRGEALFPLVTSWFRKGPVATIIDNPGDTPAGYSNLSAALGHPGKPVFVTPPTGPPPPVSSLLDRVTVNQPHSLKAGILAAIGQASDPMQAVFASFHTYGVPALNSSDWVQAKVNPQTGAFTANLTIDHPGVSSTVYTHTATGPVTAQWSATPLG